MGYYEPTAINDTSIPYSSGFSNNSNSSHYDSRQPSPSAFVPLRNQNRVIETESAIVGLPRTTKNIIY